MNQNSSGLKPDVPNDGTGVNESGEEFFKESIAHVFPLAWCNKSKRLARNAGRQIQGVFAVRSKKNCCGKSKRSGFEPLSHSWRDRRQGVLHVILPKVCQPLLRCNDYFYLNTYPYGSPQNETGRKIAKEKLEVKRKLYNERISCFV